MNCAPTVLAAASSAAKFGKVESVTTTRSSDMVCLQVVVDDLAGDESEISAPEKAFQRFRNRQPKYGSLRVRPQFDRARTSPTFMNAHVGQMARGQLPDCRRAVDMVDDF